MSLLDDLRLDIADDTGAIPSGVLVPASCSLLSHLRLDIADDTGTGAGTPVQSGVSIVVGDLTVEGDLIVCGAQYWGRRIITAPGDVTVQSSDNFLLINKTVGQATTVTIPAPGATNKSRLLIIKDMKGDAFTNNITIVSSVGTIDGQNAWILNQNYQSFSLIDNGAEWNII